MRGEKRLLLFLSDEYAQNREKRNVVVTRDYTSSTVGRNAGNVNR